MPSTAPLPILLVDDSLVFLKVLGAVFTKAGYQVETACTGVEAMVRAMEEPFAAVVSDCQMPIMTGFELCRLLKNEAATRHLPVVLMTSTEHRLGRLWCRTCGADRFWIKRDNYEHLVGVVRELTGKKKSRHAAFQPPPQISLEDIQRRMSEVLEHSVLELSLRHTVGSIGIKHQSLGKELVPKPPRAALGAPGGTPQGRRDEPSGSRRFEPDAAGNRPPPQPEGTTPGGRSAASAPFAYEPHGPAGPSLRSIPPDDVAAHGGFGTSSSVAWPFLDLAYDLVSPGALYCVLPTWEGHRAFGIHSRGIDPRAAEVQIGPFPWVHGEVHWEWKDFPAQEAIPTELVHGSASLDLVGGDGKGQWGYLVEDRFPASCIALLDIAQEEFQKVLQASVAVDMLRGAIRDLDRANAAKTEYVQTLCHEIRNPLSAAMGSLELAQSDEPPGTPRAKNLSRAMDAMERQLYLLNVVLDVEKLEAHGTELLRMDVDLEALVRRAFLLMEGAAGKKAVSFELMEDGEGPWLLQGDPDRLLQCLSNLLGNAIKFTPSKSTVTVALARSIGIVRMEIRDQGEGLPKGFEDRIFGKFQQGGETPGGSGLGLSITRRLVEAMGGIVGVQSRPGEGATFWVELPAGS